MCIYIYIYIKPILSTQFTIEYSKDVIPFLNILFKRNIDKIWMDIYYKPTDTLAVFFILLITLNIAKGMYFSHWHVASEQLLKTLRKMKHLDNLKMNLSKYQYPKQLLESGFSKALSIPLQEFRTPKTISNDNSLPFITT